MEVIWLDSNAYDCISPKNVCHYRNLYTAISRVKSRFD